MKRKGPIAFWVVEILGIIILALIHKSMSDAECFLMIGVIGIAACIAGTKVDEWEANRNGSNPEG